ncbi:MAG: DUF5996 family protein [Spirochaetaceae bacterium]|jgi:hypothetical protein|nr:DUF5996 family protein [Spirochaetaceae bacterium]
MNIPHYNEWEETALTIHLISQMMGKVKLSRMDPQPEWKHIVLNITPEGFSTGLIPNGEQSFGIRMLAREGKVVTTRVDGHISGFAFRNNTSVSEYYNEFNRMLADVTCETDIYTVPQEMSIVTPFEKITEKSNYNNQHALDFFAMCVFAHNAILKFIAPFRGKKTLPSFFWGTFDVTGLLFSGVPAPFPGKGVIERNAFDEQLIEFGFWPGDPHVSEPSFFILPYPFLTAEPEGRIRPDEAFFNARKAEYFLSLRDAFSAPDPEQTVCDFLMSGFDLVSRAEKWPNLEWYRKPLGTGKGSAALH